MKCPNCGHDIGEPGELTLLPALPPASNGKALVRTADEVVAGLQSWLEAEVVQRATREERRWKQAELVFSYWQKKLRHPRSKYDPRERGRIIYRALVSNKGDVNELLYVVDAVADDAWASDDLGRHDISVIFRDRTHIEKYAERVAGYRAGRPHRLAEHYRSLCLG